MLYVPRLMNVERVNEELHSIVKTFISKTVQTSLKEYVKQNGLKDSTGLEKMEEVMFHLL